MSVTILHGDIFASAMQTLVNPVNCIGAMGAGLALQFKRRFPEMFKDYVQRCVRREVKVGEPYLYTGCKPWVLNFPTKDDWRNVAQVEWIVAGLEHLATNCSAWNIESLAVPALGCGLGGLPWSRVRPVLQEHLDRLAIPVELYQP